MNALTLVISDTVIHQDATGHYSLNDFHKAAGDEPKHKPANFLRLDNTKALIDEIDRFSDLRSVNVINGNNPGTYAVKEIIYAYAMWISPAFSLKVIRTFDALVTGNTSTRDYEALQHKYITLLEQDNARLKSTFSAPGVAFGQHRGWTAAQDAELLALKAEGLGYTAIGVRVGRSRENCRYRYNNLIAKQGGAV